MKELSTPPWLKAFILRIFKSSGDPLNFFESLVKYQDIVRFPVLRANYVVNDPDAIYKILLTNADNYTKLNTSYERIENVVGKGLLTTSGEEWEERRKRFQPSFHGKHLNHSFPVIQKYTEKMLQSWEQNSSVNVTDEILKLVMSISSESLLGIDVSEQSFDLVKMIHIMNAYSVRSLFLWKWLPTFRNIKYQTAKKTVDNYILNHLTADNLSMRPLLETLFKQDESGQYLFSTNEILGEVKNFFIAGHETTGNAISWTLYCLAKHPFILKQVQSELEQAVGGQDVTVDCLEELPYLDLVIAESLRLYPVIWIFTRSAIDDDDLSGYHIKGGSIINILPYLIHRHPAYWHQPTIFYPERFTDVASKNRPKCAYIPFGFGPRVCIGRQFALMTMKMILAMILKDYDINLPTKNYQVRPLPLITLKPNKGITLKIEKR
jgi:cytochrome P450